MVKSRAVWWGGVGLVVLAAGAATLVATGWRPGGIGLGQAQAAASPASAASAPLVFRANEVLSPVLAMLPQTIEFSGPLVAPSRRCCAPRPPARCCN